MSGETIRLRTNTPKVSVIVCTRNRERQLERCIASLEHAAGRVASGQVEIVIVDNGSSDATRCVIDEFAARSSVQVLTVTEVLEGLSRARNAGMSAARGELFAFIDDDCIVDPAYFAVLLECYANDPQAVRGGRVDGDQDDFPVSIRPSADAAVYNSDLKPGGFILGCNFVVPRRLAETIGCFDERFGAGGRYRSAEDTDYVLRAHLAGAPVLYEPAMRVAHHHGRRTRRALRDIIWAYETGNGALYAKHARACPSLSRHVGWTLRNALKEWVGGSKFIAELGVSHWTVLAANLVGVFHYLMDAAGDRLRWVARPGANAPRLFEAPQSRSSPLHRSASPPASECG